MGPDPPGATRPTRIGYLFEHPTVSGAEGSALDLLAHIDRSEFEPTAFAPETGELASRLRALGIPRRAWRAPRDPGEEADLVVRLRTQSLDILHANTIQLGRLTGRIAGSCGAAGVAHIRAFGALSGRARRNLCANEMLIAVSQAVRAHLIEEGVPPDKIRVVRNGVSAPPEREGPAIRAELGLDPRQALAVWLGQITVRKGPGLLVDVARRAIPAHDGLHFLLAGDVFGEKEENRALKRAIVRAAESPPLRGRFHLLGWRRDAFAILRQATLLVHTARQEPLSRVLIEALAAGTPIVATAVGGTPEVVGECGVLVPPDDPAGAAAAIHGLLEAPERMAALGRMGVERWRAHFQAERMAREISGLWRRIGGP